MRSPKIRECRLSRLLRLILLLTAFVSQASADDALTFYKAGKYDQAIAAASSQNNASGFALAARAALADAMMQAPCLSETRRGIRPQGRCRRSGTRRGACLSRRILRISGAHRRHRPRASWRLPRRSQAQSGRRSRARPGKRSGVGIARRLEHRDRARWRNRPCEVAVWRERQDRPR